MNDEQKKTRRAVRRSGADGYILTSLISFGVTVVAVRLFLQLTGFPQIGNSVLHIAHALWGALLLFVAVLLPLIFANRWAVQVSALLSGVGIGLFIDEVGKFITQKNDYFYPPAMPLIYGFFILTVFLYLYFRRPRKIDPRNAMYHALEGMQDILDRDLDREEITRIETQLTTASQSEHEDISSLANALKKYLHEEKPYTSDVKPGFWRRTVNKIDDIGHKLGRRNHRRLISILLILWTVGTLVTAAILAFILFGGFNMDDETTRSFFSASELAIVDSSLWLPIFTLLEFAVGALAIFGFFAWLRGNEDRGQKISTFALVIALVLIQPLSFYMNQFAALTGTLYQFTLLLIIIAYRRWYLEAENE